MEEQDRGKHGAMVSSIRSALGLLVLGLPLLASAADGCTRVSEFEPALCPLRLPPIAHVVIDENAARAPMDQDTPTDCKRFVVDERLVRRYFSRAAEIQGGAQGAHVLPDSPCYAAGKLRFRDGRWARWSITSLRVGALNVEGAPEDQRLYCPRCKERPFIR